MNRLGCILMLVSAAENVFFIGNQEDGLRLWIDQEDWFLFCKFAFLITHSSEACRSSWRLPRATDLKRIARVSRKSGACADIASIIHMKNMLIGPTRTSRDLGSLCSDCWLPNYSTIKRGRTRTGSSFTEQSTVNRTDLLWQLFSWPWISKAKLLPQTSVDRDASLPVENADASKKPLGPTATNPTPKLPAWCKTVEFFPASDIGLLPALPRQCPGALSVDIPSRAGVETCMGAACTWILRQPPWRLRARPSNRLQ